VACEGHNDPGQKGIRWMRLSHARRAIDARFDDPNLVSCAGLVAVMALADRCGLVTLLGQRLKIATKGGANAAAKVLAVVAGMVCGADSIDDLDRLRHGGMGRLFDGVRAPVDAGDVPAAVHLWPRPPTRRRRRRAAGPARGRHPGAA
jgi:hypothetical protein